MDSHTYATLYRPRKLPFPPRRAGVRLLAGVLWGITMMSMAWLTFLVGMAALWGAAASAPMGGFLLDCLLAVAGAAAVLGVVAFAPGVRRMEVPHRMPLLGVIACPVPAVLAVWSWFNVGCHPPPRAERRQQAGRLPSPARLRTVRCRPGTPPDDT